ncbi:hypothetical protein BUL40_01910 [Croceivirga radicis]|uniref:PD-(D/E)XK endonuclease-like domain-containing protein n=1 Tax=Croceivirga radicis TaxID=1929488 RepID=A0A1V6LVX0_9FLAO|nr:PD-(D/E)XK nuclease family protein [Croceivirga radicis]OQD44331.1 hypothetical protein BUL40_01910 [Croceivirga radicis]
MISFLQETVLKIVAESPNLGQSYFILPSRRAGLYLKKHLAQQLKKPIISPKIISIEEFILEVSELKETTNFDLLLKLYECYLEIEPKETLADFLTWGTTLLGDFNEIDRHLGNAEELFNYITAVTRIQQWNPNQEPTDLIKGNLKFINRLTELYPKYQKTLLSVQTGYQGLIYRTAHQKIEAFKRTKGVEHYFFIGFNALNTAESEIVKCLLDSGSAKIYWDIDAHFYEDKQHEAGYFIRSHQQTWKFLQENPITPSKLYNSESKKITITGTPKNIAQAKYVGNLLKEIYKNPEIKQSPVALVLSDETLLPAVLNALPKEVPQTNITMGLPLAKTALNAFICTFLRTHQTKNQKGWYHKDILQLTSNTYFKTVLKPYEITKLSSLLQYIKEQNILFLPVEQIAEQFDEESLVHLLLNSNNDNPERFVKNLLEVLEKLRQVYISKENTYELQSLKRFIQVINQLNLLQTRKSYIKDLNTLESLYLELIDSEQIDFKGSPTDGLQIMGMLESRNLDFETVILVSVNEGILPAGKSNNSFIPFEIKKEFGLPTYKEKDAVYAYHFYRLLQRCKNAYITYNTEPDVLLGNEKSRFISQLLTDDSLKLELKEILATPKISSFKKEKRAVEKTELLVDRLKEIAASGFSPSSLSNYIKNPYNFYLQSVLRIRDVEQVEEQIAHNTFGTIIHDSLEELYLPLVNTVLTKELLNTLNSKVKEVVKKQFLKFYTETDLKNGQNLIALRVVEQYVHKQIEFDINRIKNNKIVVLGLELDLRLALAHFKDFPVFLRGKIDRIESVNGDIHILDYKTGNVAISEVKTADFDSITTSDTSLKAFQLLCYALMYHKQNGVDQFKAGIIPIKNLNLGTILFGIKDTPRAQKNNPIIDLELLTSFEQQLNILIGTILDPSVPFIDLDET